MAFNRARAGCEILYIFLSARNGNREMGSDIRERAGCQRYLQHLSKDVEPKCGEYHRRDSLVACSRLELQ